MRPRPASPGRVAVNDVLQVLQVGNAIDYHFLVGQQLDFDRGQHSLYEESPVKTLRMRQWGQKQTGAGLLRNAGFSGILKKWEEVWDQGKAGDFYRGEAEGGEERAWENS